MPEQRSTSSPDLREKPRCDPEDPWRAAPGRLHPSNDPLPSALTDQFVNTLQREIFYRPSAREPHEIFHALITGGDRLEHALTRRDVAACPSPSKG
jgi:hypothetical protein